MTDERLMIVPELIDCLRDLTGLCHRSQLNECSAVAGPMARMMFCEYSSGRLGKYHACFCNAINNN